MLPLGTAVGLLLQPRLHSSDVVAKPRFSASDFQPSFNGLLLAATATITGTATAGITEADIVTGGKTIIITLANDTWVAAGGTFDGQRQNIINGLDSAQSEAAGWDAVVKALQGVAGVVRTSDTVVTITLDAQATYDITTTETITVTIPATALVVTGAAIAGSPTFTVSAVGAGDLLLRLMGEWLYATSGGYAA